MKNIVVALVIVLFSMGCKSKKTVADEAAASAEKTEAVVQYRDDFRSVSEAGTKKFLKEMKATSERNSVLILTKGFKGEDVVIANEKKSLYKGNPISHLENGIAGYITIDNTMDTKITDKLSKREAVVDVENAKKYKFVYVMKNPSQQGNPYTITYSNKLRPL